MARRKQWLRFWAVAAVVAAAGGWLLVSQRQADSAKALVATQARDELSAKVAALEKSYRELTVGGQVSSELIIMD